MVTFGPTSDIIVAALLAVSQLIVPVPDAGIQNGEKLMRERNSCVAFTQKKSEFASKDCEKLREDDEDKFRDECEDLELDMQTTEVQCAADATVSKVLRFRPRPLQEYMKLPNRELVHELGTICSALQDRVFLEPKQWMSGMIANREEASSQLVMLEKPELQKTIGKILVEADTGEFDSLAAHKTITALCHWKMDLNQVANQVDFTGGYKYLSELLAELPRVDQLPELAEASFVYDKENRRIGEIFDREFVTRHGERYISKLSRRRNVTSAQVPKTLLDAFIAIEDKRFREHNGFDFESVKRLLASGGGGGSTQGGSTFTMQLIKNAFFDQDVERERAAGKRTLRRKIKELLMIPMVERTYRKEDILTYYLNLISLTANSQGILMTAMDLFNKNDLNDLTLAEMATLAALPKGTSIYNPWRFPERAKARRDLVLNAMAEQGYVTAKDRDEAKAEELNVATRASLDKARIYSHFFTGHITNYFETLKAINERDPRWKLGGFDIKTSFDLDLQKAVTSAVQTELLAWEKANNRYKWTPWIDETTKLNMNVSARAQKPGADMDDIFDALQAAHPYPETNWVVALKLPKSNRWHLDIDKAVPVAGGDGGVFSRLKNYDAVVLEPLENGTYRLAGPTQVQGGAVVLDLETGEVLALTGGFTAGAFGKLAQNNRVTRSKRMPGSTIKPIEYLFALNKGFQPNEIIPGRGLKFGKVGNCDYHWSPGNYGGGGGGAVPMTRALESSLNLNILNLFLRTTGLPSQIINSGDLVNISPETANVLRSTLYDVYDLAVQFGAYPPRENLNPKKMPCFPWLLGGEETTPLNMVQMYAAIGNGGLKRPAVFLRQVFKGNQPLLVDHTDELRGQVQQYRAAVKQGFAVAPEAFGAIPGIRPQAVAQLRAMMQGIVARGTATKIKEWAHLIGGKTGTTNQSKDVWFSGFTNRLAITVWVGYDKSRSHQLGSATGGGLALPIFKSIMEQYYKMNPAELENPLPDPLETPGLIRVQGPSGGDTYLSQDMVSKVKNANSNSTSKIR